MKRILTTRILAGLLTALIIAASLSAIAYAKGYKLSYGGATLELTSAGAINATPKSGQGVVVGSGTAIKKVLSATASLDFGATAAGACDVLTVNLTGAVDGDVVSLGIPHALANADAYQSFDAWVSSAGVVSVRRCNLLNSTTALSNPSAATVRVAIVQF